MNCWLKSGIHKHSQKSRVHVEVLHFVRSSSIVSLSHNRKDFVHVRHDCRGYVEIMWLCPSFSFRIPWFFWNTGSRKFLRAIFESKRLSSHFILVNAPGFRFRKFPQYSMLPPYRRGGKKSKWTSWSALWKRGVVREHVATQKREALWISLVAQWRTWLCVVPR